MKRGRGLYSTVALELTSADMEGALTAINREGITVYRAEQISPLCFRFTVQRRAFRAVRRIARKRGDSLEVLHRSGLFWSLKGLLRRPVLVLGIGMILALSWYLPGKILFVSVEGNATLPDALILERAQECGIDFFASRREVRSEKMKNALLSAVPELEWAGVNTYGCRAVISVRERELHADPPKQAGVSSIVAAVDGVVRELTVTQGNPVCKVGQSVTKGQVLISGYTDLGICIRAQRAEGEIYAQTQRDLQVVTPAKQVLRGEERASEKKISVLLGKKRINFYKGSGISDASCDKMYSYYNLTLPGGLRLPVTLVVEESCYASTEAADVEADAARAVTEDFAARYLSGVMIAGKIEARYEAFTQEQERYRLSGRYACYEMIGKTRTEENLGGYEASGTEH